MTDYSKVRPLSRRMSEFAEPLATADDKLSPDMEEMLDLLDRKLESVVTQVEKVRTTRGLIVAVSRRLEESLRLCEEDADEGSEREQLLRLIHEEVGRREQVLRELETRQVLLSHSVMNAITGWARALDPEKTGEDYQQGVYEEEDVGEGEEKDSLNKEEPLFSDAPGDVYYNE